MNFWQSLTGHLFKQVFGSYVILAIVVTVVQLSLEYAETQKTIARDLVSLGSSFRGGATGAMWELDRTLLNTMAQGIAQTSIVTGVRILSEDGKTFASVGGTPATTDADSGALLAPFQFHTTRLMRETPTGPRDLGQLTIYSNRSVAVERVKYSFLVILINSLIKTAGLWLIFYLVISRTLSRPLSQLTGVVSRLEFAAESKDPIPLNYPHQDELGRLMGAMDKMQERLFAARGELEKVNLHLEETVAERTRNLADALEFNKTILLSSPIPVGVYAASGQCVLANDAYAQFVGATCEALLAQNFHNIVTWQESRLLGDCLTALAHHAPQQGEAKVLSSFGKDVWCEYRILPTLLNGTDHLLIQFFDLTARKTAEAELIHHRDHLEELVFARTAELALAKDAAEAGNRAKTIFLANMSHELRTPMNGVMGMIDLVLRRATDPKQIDMLNKSKGAAQRMINLVNDIIDFSKAEADRLPLEERNFSLNHLIDDAIAMQDTTAEAKGLHLTREIPASFPDQLSGDAFRLRQILLNFLGNACKFSEQGTITVRVSAVEQDGDSVLVRIEVEDQGIGISPEQQATLFQAFTQVDGSMTRKYGGSGLGLIISKRLANLMGGDVGMVSQTGHGSTFWATIRLKPVKVSAVEG
jgi:PAS domain S-box-containing protein